MPYENYIEAAKKILECKPSGAAIELCERVIADGFADDEAGDEDGEEPYETLPERTQGLSERMEIRDFCVNYGVPLP